MNMNMVVIFWMTANYIYEKYIKNDDIMIKISSFQNDKYEMIKNYKIDLPYYYVSENGKNIKKYYYDKITRIIICLHQI